MGKIIRPTYPVEFSVGLLLLIFALSFLLSSQIFVVTWHELMEGTGVYGGMFLTGSAVIVMVLILWEEFFFPVKIKPAAEGLVFRNHRTKLKTQALIFCLIPAIFVFIYMNYKINTIRFFIWAGVCTVLPIVGKLVSGLRNYNDFLKLTDDFIEYKNNEKAGVFKMADIRSINLLRDDRYVLHKFQLTLVNEEQVVIDLDEMELDAFLEAIDQFMSKHYATLIQSAAVAR